MKFSNFKTIKTIAKWIFQFPIAIKTGGEPIGEFTHRWHHPRNDEMGLFVVCVCCESCSKPNNEPELGDDL